MLIKETRDHKAPTSSRFGSVPCASPLALTRPTRLSRGSVGYRSLAPHRYGEHKTSDFPALRRSRWDCRSKRCTFHVLSSTCRTNETSRSRRWWQWESDRSWRKLGSSPHRSRSEHLHPQPWRQSDYLIHYSERSEQPRVVQQLLLGGRVVYTTRTITLKRRRFRKPSPPSSHPHTHMYRAVASR
jgi:hypothetical protein